MKKLLCLLFAAILLLSANIPIFAIGIDDPDSAQAAVLRTGSSTKRYYFDIHSEGTYNVPVDVTMHWSLTYFVDTGLINSCSTPTMTATIPTSYEHYDMFYPRLISVTTNKQKSTYSCLFTSTYQVGVKYNLEMLEDIKPTDSFIVSVDGDGGTTIQ